MSYRIRTLSTFLAFTLMLSSLAACPIKARAEDDSSPEDPSALEIAKESLFATKTLDLSVSWNGNALQDGATTTLPRLGDGTLAWSYVPHPDPILTVRGHEIPFSEILSSATLTFQVYKGGFGEADLVASETVAPGETPGIPFVFDEPGTYVIVFSATYPKDTYPPDLDPAVTCAGGGGDICPIYKSRLDDFVWFMKNAAAVYDESDDAPFVDTTVIEDGRKVNRLNQYRPAAFGMLEFSIAAPEQKSGASNVLFLPGIEGSQLFQKKSDGSEKKVWPLNLGDSQQTAKALYLNADGTSAIPTYTKAGAAVAHLDITAPVTGTVLSHVDVYDSFFAQLAGLKSAGTIADYLIFPYDWRMSPDKVVDGTPYDDGTHHLDQELIALAATSKSGKVTIVGHSNGGLVAKALMLKLQAEGKADLVDKVIFVDSPQLGTPMAVGSMLHGDFNPFPFFMLSKDNARGVSENMPDGFALLPSTDYFAKVAQPVADLTNAPQLRAAAGVPSSIADAASLAKLMTGVGRNKPSYGDVETPDKLSATLLAQSSALHASLDNWAPPAGVQVIQIAGWGIDTPAGINYFEDYKTRCVDVICSTSSLLRHTYTMTEDGDKTVVAASETATSSWSTYYINLQNFNLAEHKDNSHSDIAETEPFESLFSSLLKSSSPTQLPTFVSTNKPTPSHEADTLRLRVLSPVSLDAYDTQGRHTGLIQPYPGSDLLFKEEEIPNSYYEEFGEGKYLGLPDDGSTHVEMKGLDTGTFTFEVTPVSGGVTGATSSYKDIPVTEATIATAIPAGNTVSLALDTDGNGTTDIILASSTASETPITYLKLMNATIGSIDMGTTTARQLTAKLANISHILQKDSKWDDADDDNDKNDTKKNERLEARALRKLDKLDAWIGRQLAKSQKQEAAKKKGQKNGDKLTETQAAAILDMTAHLRSLIK